MFLSAEILIISYHEWCYKVKHKEGSYNSPVHVEVELLMKLWSLPYHWCIYEFVFQCSARSNKGRLFVCMDSRIAPFNHYFVSTSGHFSSIISFWSMVFGLDSYFSCLIVNHNNRAYSPIIHCYWSHQHRFTVGWWCCCTLMFDFGQTIVCMTRSKAKP